jgi:hypothetical protein
MFRHKKSYNQNQFIPKTIEEAKGHLSSGVKNNTKLSYDEIRQIVENKNKKDIPRSHLEPQIKNKFNIV